MPVCELCQREYQAPALTYDGLCPDHWNRDTLREWDRLATAKRRVLPPAKNTLTLAEWLAIINQFRGMCALCEQIPFSVLAIWTPRDGLTASNVAPLCRACAHHKDHSFLHAVERVTAVLQASTQPV